MSSCRTLDDAVETMREHHATLERPATLELVDEPVRNWDDLANTVTGYDIVVGDTFVQSWVDTEFVTLRREREANGWW